VTIRQPPARAPGRQCLLFTPGARLGWTFRDRRSLITPYAEPPPDQELIREQVTARAASTQRSYQRARKWVARPSLILAASLAVIAGCAKAINPAADTMIAVMGAVVLCLPGLAWTGWRWRQKAISAAADPVSLYELERHQWIRRTAAYEQTELSQLADMPEWGSAEPPARRTDIFGGTLHGWQSLLAVHGASILSERPLLIADLSGQYVAGELGRLARHAGIPGAEYRLPDDLGRFGLLARITPVELAEALAEAIHAGAPGGARADRAVDVRVMEQLASALTPGGVTPVRLATAVQAALGHPIVPGALTSAEIDLIQGSLFPGSYRPQVFPDLIRLDAFLVDLARHTVAAPTAVPPPAYYTCLAVRSGARTARAELLAALVIQWLTVQVTAASASTPAVVIAGADEITRAHLERLSDACERRGVSLTLLFRHLRDDAISMVGQGSTAFMRLGNHAEAEQAASFLGRHHTFVLSQFTATYSANTTRTSSDGYSHGASQSRGVSSTRSWSDDGILDRSTSGSRTRSRDNSSNQGWSSSMSQADGASWSDAAAMQRVYEYAVEPTVLQQLPDNALLLADRGAFRADLRAVECHPSIITLPHASTRPLPQAGYELHGIAPPAMAGQSRPRIEPQRYQPQWPLDNRAKLGKAPPRPSWQRDEPPGQRD
jgi:hypothetical protein